jgi:anti-sigma factor RsiW
MTCDDVRPRLTAYLDGDLDADRGTVIRGHLRTCDACREIAEREAVLRDELRNLPLLDPPPAMWAGIQERLAAAEIAESKRPAWKRLVARWTPMLPRFAIGGALAAAAVGILWWRTHEPASEPQVTKVIEVPPQKIEAAAPKALASAGCNLDAPAVEGQIVDVTEDLAAEAARVTACYEHAANELLAQASAERDTWSAEQRAAFDKDIAELKRAVDGAEEGRPRQKAWRSISRYVQTTLTRDRVAFAGGAQ